MTTLLKWYGYRHNNGTLHVRRYLGKYGDAEIEDCRASPYIREIFGPFDAQNQHSANCRLRKLAGPAP
jgi:hypothetical protein